MSYSEMRTIALKLENQGWTRAQIATYFGKSEAFVSKLIDRK